MSVTAGLPVSLLHGLCGTKASGAEMYDKLQQRSFLLLLVVVTVLFFYLLKPFFGAIFWACAIAIIFFPVQRRLTGHYPNSPNLTALATLSLCIVIVIIPVLVVAASVVQEGLVLYQKLSDGEVDPAYYLDQVRAAFPLLNTALETAGIDLAALKARAMEVAVSGSRVLAQQALSVGQNTFQFVLALAVMVYLSFFLLRDGPALTRLLIRALPLGDEREHLLFQKFAEVTRATVKGNLVVAIVQGMLGGLAFWALSIPGPFLWGVIMAVLSLIPAVGAGLIWAPVAIYLMATGAWVSGLVLSAFGVLVIGLVDNVLRPVLVGRDTKLPDYVVLLSTLGGLALFGINGFVIGPLIAALFIAFWGIFIREFNG